MSTLQKQRNLGTQASLGRRDGLIKTVITSFKPRARRGYYHTKFQDHSQGRCETPAGRMRKKICLSPVCTIALGMLSLLRSAGSFACTSGLRVSLPAFSASPDLPLKIRADGQARRLRSSSHPIFHCAIQTYCPDPVHPQIQSLNPPVPDHPLPPLIHHILTEDAVPSITAVLREYAGLSPELAEELLEFGAIWIALPEPGSKNQHGVGKTRRASRDEELPAGSYVRVHVSPKRHLRATQVDWASRILDTTADFVVVDKPQGVPTVPTVDNLKECVLYQVSQLVNEDLLVTSRLDKCTSGVLVLARSAAACEKMNRSLRERKVDKIYRLLCYQPLPLGPLRHLASNKRTGHKNSKPSLLRSFDAKLLRADGDEDDVHSASEWQLAELVVLSCSEFKPALTTSGATLDDGLGRPRVEQPCYQCEVRLITGRTHQVRLQAAAAAGGIVGDTRYLPVAGLLHGANNNQAQPASSESRLQDANKAQTEAAARPLEPRHHQHGSAKADGVASASEFGPEPDVVALQAYSLQISLDLPPSSSSRPESQTSHASSSRLARYDPERDQRDRDDAQHDLCSDASGGSDDRGGSYDRLGWTARQPWWSEQGLGSTLLQGES